MSSEFGKVDEAGIAEKLCQAAHAFDEDDDTLGREIIEGLIKQGITYRKCIEILLERLSEDEIRTYIPALVRVPSSRNAIFARELFRTGRLELMVQILSSKLYPGLDLQLLDEYCEEFGEEATFGVIEYLLKEKIDIRSPGRIAEFTFYMKRDISESTKAILRLHDLGVKVFGKSNLMDPETGEKVYQLLDRQSIADGSWLNLVFLNDWYPALRSIYDSLRSKDTARFLELLDQLGSFDSLLNKTLTNLFNDESVSVLDNQALHQWLCGYLARPHKHSAEVALAGVIYFYAHSGQAAAQEVIDHYITGRNQSKRGLQGRRVFDVFSNPFDIIDIFRSCSWKSDKTIVDIISLIRPLLPHRKALAILVQYFLENHSSLATPDVIAILEATKDEVENYERAELILKSHADHDDTETWLKAVNEISSTVPKLDQRIWSIGFEIAVRTRDRKFFNFLREKIESDPTHVKSYLLMHCVDFELEMDDFVAARDEILTCIEQGVYVRPQEVTSLIRACLPDELEMSFETLQKIKAADVKLNSRSITALCERYRNNGSIQGVRKTIDEFYDELGSSLVFALIQLIQAEYEFGDPAIARKELAALRELDFPDFPHLSLAHYFSSYRYPGLNELVRI